MPNVEASSLPVPTAPRVLLRVEALPVERHPAAVYLSSLGSGSRRTMRQSLGVIAEDRLGRSSRCSFSRLEEAPTHDRSGSSREGLGRVERRWE